MASDVFLALEGKVALITGGSRGIGAACVGLFVRAGAKVVFNYVKALAQAEKLVNECGADNCHAVQADLSGTATAEALVKAAVNRFGSLDILVGNHGIWLGDDAAIDKMPDAQWSKTLAVNLDSSQRGEAGHVDYAATKGALISMVKGLSTELAPFAIRVNCVAPGWVETDMSADAIRDAKRGSAIFATIPLGRVATPEEIAGPVLFLCTPYAGFITGEIFNVNGGAVLVG